jgi:FAD:protein FMN transferase
VSSVGDRLGIGAGRTEFPVWGGLAVVCVADVEDPGALARAHGAVKRTISDFDRACSSFRDDSELVAVNAGAGHPVKVGNLLFEAVGVALHAARVTDGAVDPTVGQALIAHGFSPGTAMDSRQRGLAFVCSHRAVRLDQKDRSILIPRGVTVDLGATAKALATDRAAAAAAATAGCAVLVSLGGDIATVGQPPVGGWTIRVTDDHRADLIAPGQTVSLKTGCLASSSTTVRRGPNGSHHLIDPATGAPAAEVFRTASVAASTCLEANTISTAAIVRGAQAVAWVDSIGVPVRLVGVDGRALHLGGWPVEGEDLMASSH